MQFVANNHNRLATRAAMKPLMLNGHTRALTQIRYNAEGDLLFSAAKDDKPCVWYSHNGERLGTFDGHKGNNPNYVVSLTR